MDPSLAGAPSSNQEFLGNGRPPLWHQALSWPVSTRTDQVPTDINENSSPSEGTSDSMMDTCLGESDSVNEIGDLPAIQTCEEQTPQRRKELSLQTRSHSMPEAEKQSISPSFSKSGRPRQGLQLPSFKSLGIANPQPSSLLTPPDEIGVDPLIGSVLDLTTPHNGRYHLTTADISPADSPPLHLNANVPTTIPTLSSRHNRPPHIEFCTPSEDSRQGEQPPSTSSSSATESIGGPGWYDQAVEKISNSTHVLERGYC